MIKNEKSIIIHRPIEEVFEYISNLENSVDWQPGLLEVKRITEGPLRVGTIYSSARKFLGRKMEASNEFVTYEPNKQVVFTGSSGPMTFLTSFTFEDTGEGTRFTTLIEMQPGGLLGLAEGLIASNLRQEMDSNLEILEGLMKSREAVSS